MYRLSNGQECGLGITRASRRSRDVLVFPDGEGASVPLGQWGEVGFRNANSLLVLTVPLPMAGWVRQKVGSAIVRGPIEALSLDGTARVAEFWIQLHPGMRAAFPLGMFGECGVEAG